MSELLDVFGRDRLDVIVEELRRAPSWPRPFDDAADRELADILARRYPQLDTIKEIESWRVWMMDHPKEKRVHPRARVRTWFERAGTNRGSSGAGSAQRRTRPRSAADFGDTSQTVGGW